MSEEKTPQPALQVTVHPAPLVLPALPVLLRMQAVTIQYCCLWMTDVKFPVQS